MNSGFVSPRRQVVVDEDRCTILPFPVVRLQFRACAVDVVAQALALEPHDDGACPWTSASSPGSLPGLGEYYSRCKTWLSTLDIVNLSVFRMRQ